MKIWRRRSKSGKAKLFTFDLKFFPVSVTQLIELDQERHMFSKHRAVLLVLKLSLLERFLVGCR